MRPPTSCSADPSAKPCPAPGGASGRTTGIDRSTTPEQPPAAWASRTTSLDPSETNQQHSPPQGLTQRGFHRRTADARLAAWRALASSPEAADHRRADKLASCCRVTEIRIDDAGSVRVCPHRCRDRLCGSCLRLRSLEQAERASVACSKCSSARFLTLTAPAVSESLSKQLRTLRRALSLLRRSESWRGHVTGGLYAIQITRNTTTGLWHPHIHLVVDGTYYPVGNLREAWREALNASGGPWRLEPDDALIVDARAVHDRNKTARYVAKYVTQPDDFESWGSAAILEYAHAIQSSRMLTTFGHLHGMKMPEREDPEDRPESEFVTTTEAAERRARSGCEVTRNALRVLGRASPVLANVSRYAHHGSQDDPTEPTPAEIAGAVADLNRAYRGPPYREGSSPRSVGCLQLLLHYETSISSPYAPFPPTSP